MFHDLRQPHVEHSRYTYRPGIFILVIVKENGN